MTPYYEDDLVTLYHGDCRDILPRLAGAGIGLVVADPPYGISYATNHRVVTDRPGFDLLTTELANDGKGDALALMADAIAAMTGALADDAQSYWFAAPLMLGQVMPIVGAFGDIPNVLVWDKGNCTAGDLAASYGKQWEAVIFARRARRPLVGGRDRDILRYSRPTGTGYRHPTQKPVDLIRYLIGRHDADLVLDPFAGSGTTLVAARQLNRRAIGIELDRRFCDVIVDRLKAQAMQPALQLAV